MYNCKYCGREFKDKGNLRKHEKYTHEESAFKYECPHCGKKLTASGVAVHIERCLKNPDRVPTQYELKLKEEQSKPKIDVPGECKFCGKYCHNQNSLKNHERLCKFNNDRVLPPHNPNSGWPKGKPGWSRGLTKETDPRVAKQAVATKLGIEKSRTEHPDRFTGKAKTHEAEIVRRQNISKTMHKNPNSGGKRHGSGRGEKGWYKGFFCDSTYELVFVIYNLDNNIEFKKCERVYSYTYKNETHKYYPDFELPDGTIVEIKGYHSEVVDVKTACVTDRPIKVLYEKDLQYAFDWVKEHYTYNELSDLYV